MIKSVTLKRKSTGDINESEKAFKSNFGGFCKCALRNKVGWNLLPDEVLLKIFHFLSPQDLGKALQVCHTWNSIGQDPSLWRTIEINIGNYANATNTNFLQFILENHRRNLKSVIFRIDSAVESVKKVCQILGKLEDSSLRTLALISSARSVFFGVDQESITSALTVIFDQSESLRSLAVVNTPVDDPSLKSLAANHSKTLQLLEIKSCPKVSPAGMVALADNCRLLKELSLSYALLSDDLILSLSSAEHVCLTHLRIDVYTDPETCHFNPISSTSWRALTNHSPNMNIVLYFFIVDEEMYESFFQSYNPVTYLYFCENIPRTVLKRISQNCPQVKELVISGTDSSCLDLELMGIGRDCQFLSSISLSDCCLTCLGFVEFVKICRDRLTEVFINEDCFIQDSAYDLDEVITCVSQLLLKDWAPEFTPLW